MRCCMETSRERRERPRLGEILQAWGTVSEEQLTEALERQARTGGLLGEVVVAYHGVTRLALASALSEQWDAELVAGETRAGAGARPVDVLATLEALQDRVDRLEMWFEALMLQTNFADRDC